MRRHTDGGAEETCEMERTDMRPFCKSQQRHIVGKLRVDAFENGAKLKCIQLATQRWSLRSRDAVIREQVQHQTDGQGLRVHSTVRSVGGEFCTKRRGEISNNRIH